MFNFYTENMRILFSLYLCQHYFLNMGKYDKWIWYLPIVLISISVFNKVKYFYVFIGSFWEVCVPVLHPFFKKMGHLSCSSSVSINNFNLEIVFLPFFKYFRSCIYICCLPYELFLNISTTLNISWSQDLLHFKRRWFWSW